ncbi:MAG: cob(I)yrinic acid a,c-diamide adenosyltransferase [bacterium]
MKIYTKKGDHGETGTFGGTRIRKSFQKIAVIGTLDELNSWLGLINSYLENSELNQIMQREQEILFKIGAYLMMDHAVAEKSDYLLSAAEVEILETEIDLWTSKLASLKNFILPGGTRAACDTFIARSVCRRFEHELVALTDVEGVAPAIMQYVNRLSDWLFTLARYLNQLEGAKEVVWKAR